MNSKDFLILDLTPYFNADCISYDSNRADGAFGLSCFPAEELPASDSLVYVNGIPFIFPSKEDGCNNNIECLNQIIKVEKGHYSKLFILASCDNGSFEERIELLYTKERMITELNVTNWIEPSPAYNEFKAFECSHVHVAERDINLHVKIWMQSIDLSTTSELLEIHLPDNICTHILGITLYKGGV